MKKHLFYIATGLLALSASCSSENAVQPLTGEGEVTFNVAVPTAINSRAISDGTTVDDLYWVVYNTADNSVVDDGSKIGAFAGDVTETTVSIKLVYGKKYRIAFWAQAPNAPFYTLDTSAGTVTVSYANANANIEERDAFYKCIDEFTYSTSYNPGNIILTRPFAQVNVGATDYSVVTSHNGAVTNCGMTFSAYACTKLDLLTGEATGAEAVTFKKNGLPGGGTTPLDLTYTLPNANPQTAAWLCMNYILVPADRGTVGTVTFTYDGDNGEETRSVTQVPVQRNYRTNILGDILTSEKDFRIIINPIYEGEHDDTF